MTTSTEVHEAEATRPSFPHRHVCFGMARPTTKTIGLVTATDIPVEVVDEVIGALRTAWRDGDEPAEVMIDSAASEEEAAEQRNEAELAGWIEAGRMEVDLDSTTLFITCEKLHAEAIAHILVRLLPWLDELTQDEVDCLHLTIAQVEAGTTLPCGHDVQESDDGKTWTGYHALLGYNTSDRLHHVLDRALQVGAQEVAA